MSILGLYQTGCQFRGVFLTELVAMGCFCEDPPYFSQTLTQPDSTCSRYISLSQGSGLDSRMEIFLL